MRRRGSAVRSKPLTKEKRLSRHRAAGNRDYRPRSSPQAAGNRGLPPLWREENRDFRLFSLSRSAGNRGFRRPLPIALGWRRDHPSPAAFRHSAAIAGDAAARPHLGEGRRDQGGHRERGPEAVGAAGPQVPRQTNLVPCHHTRRTNSPQKGLGVNQVDLGGMSSPASATAMSSSMAVGHTVNATASPASRAAASSASGPTVPAT